VDAPRLTVEIVPTSLHGKSPREVLGKAWWDKRRRQAYAAAGYRCEICGGVGPRHPVEAHERYEYDQQARPPVQRVLAIIAVCPACHAVKHLYRTHAISRERGDPAIYQAALDHLATVNGWDPGQVRGYLDEVRAEYLRREALGRWTQDVSALEQV
jgi:hypothetical protein